MSHALSSNFGTGNFNAAFITNNAFKTYLFVFTAETFIVFGRPEDSFAEKPISFRFQSTVIDGFRFGHFAIRPASDLFRRC